MKVTSLVLAAALGLCALALGSASAPSPARADSPITASVTRVENQFPKEIVFTAQASSTAGEVRSLRFHMTTGRALVERADAFEFTPGRNVTGTFTLKTAGNNFIPAGATLTYWLEVQDSAGNTHLTEKQQYWYADTRFEWSRVQEGPVTVYYYGNAAPVARSVLAAAREVEENTGQLLGVAGQPFTVMLYNRARDIIGAQREEVSETRSQELIRVGVAYSGEALVQVLAAGGTLGAQDTARHEIAHLFVHWAAGSGVPTWLNEGLAVWSQQDPGREYTSRLERAIRTDTLLLVRGMESFPGGSEETLLAYGQSWSLVKYLIDTYGREKFTELFRNLDTLGAEGALRKVYGFESYDDFDAKWRASVGAPPRSYATARPTPVPVFGGDEPETRPNQPPTSGGQGGGPPLLPLAAGAVVVLVAAALFTIVRGRKPAS